MINVSTEFEQSLSDDNRNFLYYADITLADGTSLNLTGENIWSGTFKIDDSVSSDSAFDIGDAIINSAALTINNIYEEYSDYDFTDAKAVLYMGLQLAQSLEKIKKFTGTADDTKYNGSLIALSFLDNMSKFDKDFDFTGIEFPATIDTVVRYCCDKCGVLLNTYDFPNKDFVIDTFPDEQSQAVTYRQIISYCAQICCCFARCNADGQLELKWYNEDALKGEFEVSTDGGTFDTDTVPYSDGDAADGGTFDTDTTPYSDGDSIDANNNSGGAFESLRSIHYFTSSSSHEVGTDDVVITGVKVSTKSGTGSSTTSYTKGEAGYVISVENNPLVTEENIEKIGDFLGKKLIGFTFRTLTASVLPDPSVEAGDVGYFFDRKGKHYPVILSSVTFTAGQFMQIKSSAATPARKSAARYSQGTQTYVELRKRIKAEVDARKLQGKNLEDKLNNVTSGLYTTIEQADSGYIYYLHNKANLNESDIVWKMTAEAWGVSTDGGKTYNGGMTVDGDTIVRILTATGVNASWINTGILTIKDSDGNVTFQADTATGEIYIKAQNLSAKVGETYKTLEDIANDADETIQTVWDNSQKYADSTSANAESNAKFYADTQDNSVRSEMTTQRQEIETTFQTAIEQTQNSLTLSIQQNSQSIQDNADNLQAYKDEQETYFHFTSDGLEIGKTTNGNTPFSTLLSDQKLAFRQNGQDVAYIQYTRMHINAIEAVERWSVGAAENGGFFDFISTKYGMGVKWRAVTEETTTTASAAKVMRLVQVYKPVTDESGVFSFG